MKVADLMSSDVITVEPNQDLGIALALMVEFGIRRLPVIDLESGQLVGIVCARDVRGAMQSPFLPTDVEAAVATLELIRVREIMTTDLVVIGPTATVGEAARQMMAHGVGGLPVVAVDGGGMATLIGMITVTDLLRLVVDLEGSRAAEG